MVVQPLTFVDGSSSDDDVVETMGEDAVSAITTGEDETEAERGDGDADRVVATELREGLFDQIADGPEEEGVDD